MEAMAVCRGVRDDLATFRDLALASVIANTLDYGSVAHTVTENFVEFFRQEFAAGLTVDETEAMEGLTSRVVYLADNCGEIVFDALFADRLKKGGSHVTFAVRGAPILNDATLRMPCVAPSPGRPAHPDNRRDRRAGLTATCPAGACRCSRSRNARYRQGHCQLRVSLRRSRPSAVLPMPVRRSTADIGIPVGSRCSPCLTNDWPMERGDCNHE